MQVHGHVHVHGADLGAASAMRAAVSCVATDTSPTAPAPLAPAVPAAVPRRERLLHETLRHNFDDDLLTRDSIIHGVVLPEQAERHLLAAAAEDMLRLARSSP